MYVYGYRMLCMYTCMYVCLYGMGNGYWILCMYVCMYGMGMELYVCMYVWYGMSMGNGYSYGIE